MTALASGAVAWRDGLLLEDYLDAVDAMESPQPREQWVDELRRRTGALSFEGVI